MKILVTGASGFIGGYLVQELLDEGYEVWGVDNYSKYGPIRKNYDEHPYYKFVKGDAKDTSFIKKILKDCDYLVAGAAMIGGIGYFHKYSYDLLSENERITASTFDAAIYAKKNLSLKKIIVISSSMVFESTNKFPTPETEIYVSPPPRSTYGFQKLACEYFAKGAWEQYGLPYTIIRPFNCVGIGERKAKIGSQVKSGNIKLAMSHVVPDLIQKIIKGQYPVHIFGSGRQIRHYTYGGDIAKGIKLAMLSPKAKNEDFNISTEESTSVLELAKLIFRKINPNKKFACISDEPFEYDVQKRIPDVSKAKKILGFEAKTSLDQMLDEVIPWVREEIRQGII